MSLTRDEGGKISDISWSSVWLERNHTYPRSSSARDCPAALHSHQQWELNRFVNFPGGFLCLGDLVVESVWIRFAERQSIHSFRDAGRRGWGGGGASLLSRDITSEACCADNANLISNKQICPISNNVGTPPNLKDKQRFRMCQPLVWLCEKVTAALSGKKQDTNYPLPPELKKLLEHVLSKHDHCGAFFFLWLHPWHEIPPIFYLFFPFSVGIFSPTVIVSLTKDPISLPAADSLRLCPRPKRWPVSHLVPLLVLHYGVKCVSDDACSLFGLCSAGSISGFSCARVKNQYKCKSASH